MRKQARMALAKGESPNRDGIVDATRGTAQPLIETPQQVRCMTAPLRTSDSFMRLCGRYQGAVRTTSVR